ncbi:MAG: DUF2207 domain-containing protein, partial [[Bacteroides] pectinophilus]|nr:DUF2207 domain-containing protein [[Bacteroides] pectinophilus]
EEVRLFHIKKKKVFKSSRLNRLTMADRLVWLIPIGFMLRDIIITWDQVKEVLTDNPSPGVIAVMLLAQALVGLIQGLFWVMLAKVIVHTARRQLLKRSTFITVNDIDYYRDKLDGLAPGTISLLADLAIEKRKDIAACILRYENLGILGTDEYGKYVLKTDRDLRSDTALRNSDRYLIKALTERQCDMVDEAAWQRMAVQEAIDDGYIYDGLFAKRSKGRETAGKAAGCFAGCVMPIIVLVIMAAFINSIMPQADEFDAVLSALPDSATFREQVEYISMYPQYYPVIAKMIVAVLVSLAAIFTPLVMVVWGIVSTATKQRYRRTPLGNEMAEYVYGMKNFIHDYSNLSEADKSQLALWDDYLIYAVVLEENEQIVADIRKMRLQNGGI